MKKHLLLFILFLISVIAGYSKSWVKLNTGFNYIFKGIEFPENQSQIGWAAGQSLTYNGNGIVIKTTNGGNSWTQLWSGLNKGLNAISFPDMNTGYICGQNAYYAKSINGGVTWTSSVVGSNIDEFNDLAFKDALHGVIVAQTNSGSAVYTTSNGGTTWTSGTGLASIPLKVCYVTDDTYFLVTVGGDIQKSTNGGLTWVTCYTGGGLLMGINFYNPLIGIAAGEDGKIIKTSNGGVTWTPQVIAFGFPLWHSFAWADQDHIYVSGTPEQIYKSTDGGSTWIDDYPQSTGNPALYEIMFTSDGYGYICGSQGWFYRLVPPLHAAFISNVSQICSGDVVQFTDQSTGAPTAWNWTFPGGNPATSSLQNPVVTYSTPGVYDVSLQVNKGLANHTTTTPNMITVNALPTPLIAGNTSVCKNQESAYSAAFNAGNTYTWTVTGGSISFGQGSNDINVLWGYPGTGNVSVTEISATCVGTSPFMSVAIDECIGINETRADVLSIYPNPAQNQLNVVLGLFSKTSVNVFIYNYLGHLIYQSTEINPATSNLLTIDISKFVSGTYTLKVTGENDTFSRTFVKK